jgi:membrane protease subunit HflK
LYLEAMNDFLRDVKGVYIVDDEQKALVPWIGLDSGMTVPLKGGQ